MWQKPFLFRDSFTVEISDSPEIVQQRIASHIVEPKLFRLTNPVGITYLGQLSESDFTIHPLPRGSHDSKPAVHISGRLEPSASGTLVRVRLNLAAHMKFFFWLLYFIGIAGPVTIWANPAERTKLPGGIVGYLATSLVMFALPMLWSGRDLRQVRADFEKILTNRIIKH